MKKILVVVPAYNEEVSVEKAMDALIKTGYDYIIINDGSNDGTSAILDEKKYNHIDLINNLGIGGAMQTGYKYALSKDYDIVVQYDADGQHNPKYIAKIIKPLENDKADIVIGSRMLSRAETEYCSTKIRMVGISIISFAIKLLSGKKIYDTTSGFRAINKKVLELFAKDYPLEYPEPISNFLLADQGYRIKEVQVSMNKRIGGRSSIGSIEGIYYAFNVIMSILLINRRQK